jgi:hypothetical protein
MGYFLKTSEELKILLWKKSFTLEEVENEKSDSVKL